MRKSYQLFLCIMSLFVLTSCTNTTEGIKADLRDTNNWTHNRPSDMEKSLGPAPIGYKGQASRAMRPHSQLLAPEYATAPSRVKSGQLVWHKVGNYDSYRGEDMSPVPLQQAAGPQVVQYSSSVHVFPVDGDMQPYMQVTASDGKPISGEMVQQLFFAHGSSKINSMDKKNLRELAQSLVKVTSDYKLDVVGHASKRVGGIKDPIKRRMINFEMAQKRANAVTTALREAGIKPSLVTATSRGDSQPNRSPGDKSQEAADRRAEVYMDER